MKQSLKWSLMILILGGLLACETNTNSVETEEMPNTPIDQSTNDLANLEGSYQWMNAAETFSLASGVLSITAPKGSDFFNNPENGEISGSAPLFYREISGDFVATAHLKPDFSSMWNAACLMMYADSTHWIKLAFENSDATGKSIVTVVTNEVSDDANGVRLPNQESIWLRLIRKGELYAMHWSSDGTNFKMARLSKLPPQDTVKIGLEAQSPVGDPVQHEFDYFHIEQKTVEDLRKGE